MVGKIASAIKDLVLHIGEELGEDVLRDFLGGKVSVERGEGAAVEALQRENTVLVERFSHVQSMVEKRLLIFAASLPVLVWAVFVFGSTSLTGVMQTLVILFLIVAVGGGVYTARTGLGAWELHPAPTSIEANWDAQRVGKAVHRANEATAKRLHKLHRLAERNTTGFVLYFAGAAGVLAALLV